MRYAFQNTPLKVNETLYVCTPSQQVIALDPATGQQRVAVQSERRSGGNAQRHNLDLPRRRILRNQFGGRLNVRSGLSSARSTAGC